jgi:hypothetical protein
MASGEFWLVKDDSGKTRRLDRHNACLAIGQFDGHNTNRTFCRKQYVEGQYSTRLRIAV